LFYKENTFQLDFEHKIVPNIRDFYNCGGHFKKLTEHDS